MDQSMPQKLTSLRTCFNCFPHKFIFWIVVMTGKFMGTLPQSCSAAWTTAIDPAVTKLCRYQRIVKIMAPSSGIRSRRRFIWTEVGPYFFSCDSYAIFHAAEAVESRPNVKGKDWWTIGFRGRRVIINDISNLFTGFRATDNPVVAIKRWFRAVITSFRISPLMRMEIQFSYLK